MKMFLAIGARVIYLLGYPIFGFYLHNSRRTRVLIRYKNEILLHRSYAGNQKWSLPGGGIHKNENPFHAAIREVEEEVGIVLSEDQMKCIGEDRLPIDRLWPRYAVVFYAVIFQDKPDVIIKRPLEVIEAAWFSIDKLPSNLSSNVRLALKHYEHEVK